MEGYRLIKGRKLIQRVIFAFHERGHLKSMEALSRISGVESRDKVSNVKAQMELNVFKGVKYKKENRDDKRNPK